MSPVSGRFLFGTHLPLSLLFRLRTFKHALGVSLLLFRTGFPHLRRAATTGIFDTRLSWRNLQLCIFASALTRRIARYHNSTLEGFKRPTCGYFLVAFRAPLHRLGSDRSSRDNLFPPLAPTCSGQQSFPAGSDRRLTFYRDGL